MEQLDSSYFCTVVRHIHNISNINSLHAFSQDVHMLVVVPISEAVDLLNITSLNSGSL